MAANCPGEMVVRMRDVLVTPGPHRVVNWVGVSVCHLAFIVVYSIHL